uniref:DM2 domain-containing protein n=1 Tax=viral metagenome TaxID=1070528 RepID=A0A6C0LTQ5_9ZZZZ
MYIVRMVRATKTSAEKQTAAPVSTPVVAEATKAPRAKKTKAVEPVATQVAAPATSAPVESTEASSVSVKMTEFSAKLQQLVGLFSTVKNDFKTLEKTVSRDLKAALKASSKRKRATGNRQPSGFVKPTLISNELAEFLGKTVGTEMARTEVSKEINKYIQSNNLKDPANGRKINPDAKLSKLLKLNKNDELTYFNLQRYMKHHFIKATATA